MLQGAGTASLLERYGAADRSINSGVPFGKGTAWFFRHVVVGAVARRWHGRSVEAQMPPRRRDSHPVGCYHPARRMNDQLLNVVIHQRSAQHLAGMGSHADDKIRPTNAIDDKKTAVVTPLGEVRRFNGPSACWAPPDARP